MRISPLQEFSDDQLINELSARFDDIVIAGRKVLEDEKIHKSPQVLRRRFWKGDMDACVGLVMGAGQDCMKQIWEKE